MKSYSDTNHKNCAPVRMNHDIMSEARLRKLMEKKRLKKEKKLNPFTKSNDNLS